LPVVGQQTKIHHNLQTMLAAVMFTTVNSFDDSCYYDILEAQAVDKQLLKDASQNFIVNDCFNKTTVFFQQQTTNLFNCPIEI
jgi:hypothetical protein